jgi:hypothetical protein
VFRRPLAVLIGLTLADYLLWNWSLNGSLSGNRDVLALVSGLTLPPLAIGCIWLLALSVARLIARSTRRSLVQAAGAGLAADRYGGHRVSAPTSMHDPTEEASASASAPASATSSDKLAA